LAAAVAAIALTRRNTRGKRMRQLPPSWEATETALELVPQE
jgi:hypothetical protein